MCKPSAKASVKAISMSQLLNQSAASLLFKVRTTAWYRVLYATSTFAFLGLSWSLIAAITWLALLTTSAKINISYSILFHLTTSYSSYFGGKKGISRNKTSFFLLMKFSEAFFECVAAFLVIEVYQYLLCFLL